MVEEPKAKVSRQWGYQLELVARHCCAQCRKRWLFTKYHCKKCAAKKTQTVIAKSAAVRSQGLCARCKKPRDKYAYNCDECQAKQTAYIKAWKEKRKAKKQG